MQYTEVSVRAFETGDQSFLIALFCAGRAEEMAAWGWLPAQQEAFLRFQFDAQQRHYAMTLPGAERRIVLENQVPVGALLVTVCAEEAMHLADIALLPEKQGRGIGTLLLQQLKEEAQKKRHDITLFVRTDNRAAIRLYERLGFRQIGASDTDLQMRWSHQYDQ